MQRPRATRRAACPRACPRLAPRLAPRRVAPQRAGQGRGEETVLALAEVAVLVVVEEEEAVAAATAARWAAAWGVHGPRLGCSTAKGEKRLGQWQRRSKHFSPPPPHRRFFFRDACRAHTPTYLSCTRTVHTYAGHAPCPRAHAYVHACPIRYNDARAHPQVAAAAADAGAAALRRWGAVRRRDVRRRRLSDRVRAPLHRLCL